MVPHRHTQSSTDGTVAGRCPMPFGLVGAEQGGRNPSHLSTGPLAWLWTLSDPLPGLQPGWACPQTLPPRCRPDGGWLVAERWRPHGGRRGDPRRLRCASTAHSAARSACGTAPLPRSRHALHLHSSNTIGCAPQGQGSSPADPTNSEAARTACPVHARLPHHRRTSMLELHFAQVPGLCTTCEYSF